MKIEAGAIREARQLAMKHLFSKGSDTEKIIEIFKEAGKEGKMGTCLQCKRKFERPFSNNFLAYDTNHRNCKSCDAKIAKAVEEQNIIDKTCAFEKWGKDVDFIADTMIESAGVPVEFQSASLKDLEQSISRALSSEQSYFIMGDVGVGKTHMAVAMMRQYLKEIKPEYDERRKAYFIHDYELQQPIFIEVPELLLRIRDTYNDKSNESEKDIVDYYSSTPFLVLDDLGTEKASDFSTLMLYLIINRRSTANLTTIITSNLDLEEIKERLSERISSRIKGMCKEINVTGHDKRCRNAEKGASARDNTGRHG